MTLHSRESQVQPLESRGLLCKGDLSPLRKREEQKSIVCSPSSPGSWNCYIIVYSSITTTVTPVTFKDLFHYPIAVSGHKHSSQANPTQPGRTKMQEKAKKKHFCCSFFSEGKEAVVISWNLAATKEQQLCFCHTETFPKQLLPQR